MHPAGVLFKLRYGKMSLWRRVWLCVCFKNTHTVYCMHALHICTHVSVYVYACVFHLNNISVDYYFVYILLPQQAQSLGSYICKHRALRGLLRRVQGVCVCVCVCDRVQACTRLKKKSQEVILFFPLFNNIYK